MKTLKLKNDTPERLDKVLAELLDVSRSKIVKMIESGDVLVDGDKANKKTLVSSQHKIEYHIEKPKRKLFAKQKTIELDVIYEDDDVLVVNKPAGLLVHPTEISTDTTLRDALVARNRKVKKVGDDEKRAGIVHRLDKFTSGVLITAKNQKAFEHLKEQFKKRKTTKKYTALVHGAMPKPHDTITLTIGRAKSTGKMAARPESQGGKSAITHYNVLEQFPHHALLDIRIETGRTNQIRAHMFAIKHPVVGDPLYKQRDQKLMNIDRIFLHSRELTITLPSGETKTFTAVLPPELEEVLELIPKI